jgi:hypothetical protein
MTSMPPTTLGSKHQLENICKDNSCNHKCTSTTRKEKEATMVERLKADPTYQCNHNNYTKPRKHQTKKVK